jgi:hypothetical protein
MDEEELIENWEKIFLQIKDLKESINKNMSSREIQQWSIDSRIIEKVFNRLISRTNLYLFKK